MEFHFVIGRNMAIRSTYWWDSLWMRSSPACPVIATRVVAATGKTDEKDFLTQLGAKTIISREEANDTSGRPLQKGRWAGVVDAVGGNILATAIKSTKYGGLVAACGNTMSAELAVSVYPFILRGVS